MPLEHSMENPNLTELRVLLEHASAEDRANLAKIINSPSATRLSICAITCIIAALASSGDILIAATTSS